MRNYKVANHVSCDNFLTLAVNPILKDLTINICGTKGKILLLQLTTLTL